MACCRDASTVCIDPQVQPTQEKFKLQEATLKVKIEDEKIQEIVVGFNCCFGYQHVAGCLHVTFTCLDWCIVLADGASKGCRFPGHV